MKQHPIYDLSAEELVQDSFQSEYLNTLAKILTGLRENLIHPTDDFERWDTKNKDVLDKILEEFQYSVVFKGSNLLTSLLHRPELLWTLTKLNPSKAGLELFFKMLGVYDGLETTLPIKTSLFHNSKEEVLDIKSCNIDIVIDADGVTDSQYLASKIEAINIFNILKVEMCTEYKVDIRLTAVKSTFATVTLIEEKAIFKTPMIKYERKGIRNLPVKGVFWATQNYGFTTPIVKWGQRAREPLSIKGILNVTESGVFKTPVFKK